MGGASESAMDGNGARSHSVLSLINASVLQMCGVRDARHRKVIMMNIEALRNGDALYDPDACEDDENDDDDDAKEAVSSKVEREVNLHSRFLCPLRRTVMRDPVICADGVSYEREAIEEWLRENDTSPVGHEKLPTKQLFPNQNLKAMIQELADENEHNSGVNGN